MFFFSSRRRHTSCALVTVVQTCALPISGEWRYVATKTATQHIVPLATQAVEILRELQPLTGRGEFVFPGIRDRKRPMSENTVNAALRRMGFDSDTMTGHGFRAKIGRAHV